MGRLLAVRKVVPNAEAVLRREIHRHVLSGRDADLDTPPRLAGDPIHERGVTAYPGLYFLGLRWQYKLKSSFIYGVGEDAAYLADRIAATPAT